MVLEAREQEQEQQRLLWYFSVWLPSAWLLCRLLVYPRAPDPTTVHLTFRASLPHHTTATVIANQQVTLIFAHLDKDGSGFISFDEFLEALAETMSFLRRNFVKLAYEKLDKDGSGQVTRADIEKAYDVSLHPEVLAGKITAAQAYTDFMSQWETDKPDGIITLDEFMAYYQRISNSIDRDEYFELMIRNAWHISGGNGPSENTTCRRVLVTLKDGSEGVREIKDDLGVGPRDFDKMRARLHRQGVHGVVKIANPDGSFKSWKDGDEVEGPPGGAEGGGGGGAGK